MPRKKKEKATFVRQDGVAPVFVIGDVLEIDAPATKSRRLIIAEIRQYAVGSVGPMVDYVLNGDPGSPQIQLRFLRCENAKHRPLVLNLYDSLAYDEGLLAVAANQRSLALAARRRMSVFDVIAPLEGNKLAEVPSMARLGSLFLPRAVGFFRCRFGLGVRMLNARRQRRVLRSQFGEPRLQFLDPLFQLADFLLVAFSKLYNVLPYLRCDLLIDVRRDSKASFSHTPDIGSSHDTFGQTNTPFLKSPVNGYLRSWFLH